MATKFKTSIEVHLVPTNTPWIRVGVNKTQTLQLTEPQWFKFNNQFEPGTNSLIVEMFDKDNNDPTTSVKINQIIINDISDNRFIWAGKYQPKYPEPWYSEQIEQGYILPPVLENINCMGWNGIWTLNIDVPAFIWIHKTLRLGWIFD